MAGSHPGAVPDCITPAKIGQLMCRGHWFMVSQKTRRAVNATWRNFKKSPPSYTASRAQAIKEVQEKERPDHQRSEEHTSELQSLMRITYAVFCLKKKKTEHRHHL